MVTVVVKYVLHKGITHFTDKFYILIFSDLDKLYIKDFGIGFVTNA